MERASRRTIAKSFIERGLRRFGSFKAGDWVRQAGRLCTNSSPTASLARKIGRHRD
jgi:hypothetical protein